MIRSILALTLLCTSSFGFERFAVEVPRLQTYTCDARVPVEVRRACARAAAMWSRASGGKYSLVEGSNGSVTVSMGCRAPFFAETIYRWVDGQPVGARVYISNRLQWHAQPWVFMLINGRGVRPRYNLNAVVLHEFGHVLGLDHSSNERATMYINLHDGADFLDNDDMLGISTK